MRQVRIPLIASIAAFFVNIFFNLGFIFGKLGTPEMQIARGFRNCHRFLMVADIFFLWAVSVPLGAAAGLVWGLSPFWIYICLKLEYLLKTVWCIARLRSRKWIRTV